MTISRMFFKLLLLVVIDLGKATILERKGQINRTKKFYPFRDFQICQCGYLCMTIQIQVILLLLVFRLVTISKILVTSL
jgi:hypothetical protein